MSPGSCDDCHKPTGKPYARYCEDCRWRYKNKPKYPRTPEIEAIIRKRYNSLVRGRVEEIGNSIGWPKWKVKRFACELGLAQPRSDGRSWTAKEEAFLEEHAGVRISGWIARKLGRGEGSVVGKLKRSKMSRRIREGYTLCDLAQCFGVDHRSIERWISSGQLQGQRRHGVSSPAYTSDAWQFSDLEVLRFIRDHSSSFELRRVDQIWFLGLIMPSISAAIRNVCGSLSE